MVTNDDKDCSIIPIKHKRHKQKKVIEMNIICFISVNIISCFNSKEDYFIIINFHVHLQAACVLDQFLILTFFLKPRVSRFGYKRLLNA